MTLNSHCPPFFFYGTLLPGQPNAHLWQAVAVTTKKAVLPNGRLYDMGHYPMLIESEAGSVKGMLVTVTAEAYEATLARLDTLEGYDPSQPEVGEYRRVMRKVRGEDGRFVSAWVYIGHPRYVAGLAPMETGDWRQLVKAKLEQITTWWSVVESLSERFD